MVSTLEALERYRVPHSAAKLMPRVLWCLGSFIALVTLIDGTF